jgi:hypothetical protein
MQPVGVYFSPKSRDYDPGGFLPSYRGALVALLQAHREIQIVTPRTLAGFQGQVLVLPNVIVLKDPERAALKAFLEHGGRLVVEGTDVTGFPQSSRTTTLPSDPTGASFSALEHDFAAACSNPPNDFLNATRVPSDIELEAPPTVAVNFGLVNGTPHVFLANFGGLVPGRVAVPAPAREIHVKIPATMGDNVTYLPFLGEAQRLRGEKKGNKVEFILPAVERGAVVWIGDAK